MKIERVDFFYLSMPSVRDIGDGSQDALLVRVEAGGFVGWGECEAAPLVSIASWVCPMSHSACKPVSASVLGQPLESVADIHRVHQEVRRHSLDLLQADHTLSGIDMALWDLLGRRLDEPVYRLLGHDRAFPKLPYASLLFGDDAASTERRARDVRDSGYRAAKFGWGPYGHGSAASDAELVRAARAGLGEEVILFVDAGTVWNEDVAAAQERLAALEECRVAWLEEPFVSGALDAYRELADASDAVRLAAGEGCHDFHQAKAMIDFAGLGYIQIDAGRIGGITEASRVARYADECEVVYVNHTFTTQLALSASLQPYAGLEGHPLCEYPVSTTALARELTTTRLSPEANGLLRVPEAPGLGIEVDLDAIRRYLVDVEIQVGGKTAYRTPEVE